MAVAAIRIGGKLSAGLGALGAILFASKKAQDIIAEIIKRSINQEFPGQRPDKTPEEIKRLQKMAMLLDVKPRSSYTINVLTSNLCVYLLPSFFLIICFLNNFSSKYIKIFNENGLKRNQDFVITHQKHIREIKFIQKDKFLLYLIGTFQVVSYLLFFSIQFICC